MSEAVFVKRYPDSHRCRAARANHRWLTRLDSGVRLPRLYASADSYLAFEHLGSRRPGPQDLGLLADALGRLHATAYRRHLHSARLQEPYLADEGLVIADFVAPRRDVLDLSRLDVGGLPVAVYKDANLRNFVLTHEGVAMVDFDDLTLAPFGYDLAKLIVSTAMTHGTPDSGQVTLAFDAYNTNVGGVSPSTVCTLEQLWLFAEIHSKLTRPYLGRNGYCHPWPAVRPWPAPC